jgi:Rrf2 family protein
MRVSAKADYAIRAMIELDAAGASELRPAKGEAISAGQQIPSNFLERILSELRVNGLVHSRRGSDGGYWLAKDPAEISVAEIIRAVEGPLASVRGEAPDELEYNGNAAPLRDVYVSLRASVRDVLENVSLADLRSGTN